MFSGTVNLRMMSLGSLGRAREEIVQGMHRCDDFLQAPDSETREEALELYEDFAKINQLMTRTIEAILEANRA